MSDPLAEPCISPAEAVCLDELMPDDLETGDLVFFEGEPFTFLHKAEGSGPLWFKPGVRNKDLLPLTSTDYLRKWTQHKIKRPGRNGPKPVETSPDLLKIAYQALPIQVRQKSDLKEWYTAAFWRRIDEAAASGGSFARNKENAKIILDEIDELLKANKIAPPQKRSARSLLRWLSRSEELNRQPAANVHGNALREYPRQISQRVLDIIVETIREAVQATPHLGPTKIQRLVEGKIKTINLVENKKT